ncbi:hypothetical protein HMPREF3036_02131 [Sutterella sp. KLE1602]|nr:hypothetical protein HMPREF3036_02131 [Sutterella sp. KLE1602]
MKISAASIERDRRQRLKDRGLKAMFTSGFHQEHRRDFDFLIQIKPS